MTAPVILPYALDPTNPANVPVRSTPVTIINPEGSSGGGAVTIADGADVAQGTTSNTAYAGTGSASLVAIGKGIYNLLAAPLPSGTNLLGKVGIDQTTPGTTNLVAAGQSGAWNITNITGSVSLPTGASTAAAQTSGNATLVTISGQIPTSLGAKTGANSMSIVQASDTPLVLGLQRTVLISGTISLPAHIYVNLDNMGGYLTIAAGIGNNIPFALTYLQLTVYGATTALASAYNVFCFLFKDQPHGTFTDQSTQLPDATDQANLTRYQNLFGAVAGQFQFSNIATGGGGQTSPSGNIYFAFQSNGTSNVIPTGGATLRVTALISY